MKKVFLIISLLINTFAYSGVQSMWLKTQNTIASQNYKGLSLRKAVARRDAHGIKFWLEHGATLDLVYNDRAICHLGKNSHKIYLPVVMYLVCPVIKPVNNAGMLEILRPYGIKEIGCQLKSGFNKISLF